MIDSKFTARVAWLTAFILFAVLMLSHSRDGAAITRERAVQDSMAAELRRNSAVEVTLLHAGDSLPNVNLRTADGHLVALRSLPRSGVKYIYAYRRDCAPCQILDTILSKAPAARRDSIAYIAFIKDSTLPAEPLPHHYAWIVDSLTKNRYFRRVPSLLVVDTSARVVAEAQESLPRVAALLDLHGVVRKMDVDTFVAVVQRRLIAKAGAAAPVQAGSSRALPNPRSR